MSLTCYRFSISWSRILPDGTTKFINEKGVNYYNKLIDGLLSANITPMVTLYHWDLPKPFQDEGGWPNPKLAQYFNKYAQICFREFGDRVKHWITFNEPLIFCWFGYGAGTHAPGISDPRVQPFQAAHTVLRAHALAYHTYDKEFRASQNGECGITLVAHWYEPYDTKDKSDQDAAERRIQLMFGWFANPIFSADGDYSEIMKTMMDTKSKEMGLSASMLPVFTGEEITKLKGSADFLGLNHYTTRLVSGVEDSKLPAAEHNVGPFFTYLSDSKGHVDPAWKVHGSAWLLEVPWGLRYLLSWVKHTYNNPKIYITENGCSDRDGTLDDQPRIHYYKSYLNEALKAVRLDGVNLHGYFAWSLIDNFEWSHGYSERFGLHYVDFNDPNRPRKPKASAGFYKKIIQNNGFPKTFNSKV